MEHLGTGCGGLLFGEVYKASVGFFPGLVFFVIVGLMFIAFLLAVYVFIASFIWLKNSLVLKEFKMEIFWCGNFPNIISQYNRHYSYNVKYCVPRTFLS